MQWGTPEGFELQEEHYLIYIFKRSLSSVRGFPGGASGKEPTCQWRSLEVYSPWVCKELDTTEATEHAPLLCDSKEAKIELGRMILKVKAGTSLVVPWLRLPLPMQGAQVRSLVRETRSHMLQ